MPVFLNPCWCRLSVFRHLTRSLRRLPGNRSGSRNRGSDFEFDSSDQSHEPHVQGFLLKHIHEDRRLGSFGLLDFVERYPISPCRLPWRKWPVMWVTGKTKQRGTIDECHCGRDLRSSLGPQTSKPIERLPHFTRCYLRLRWNLSGTIIEKNHFKKCPF